MKHSKFIYSNADHNKAGTMICTECNKVITSGRYRYKEAHHKFKFVGYCEHQHHECSASCNGWDHNPEESDEPLQNTDKSLQAIHNHMLGAHDLSLPDVELDAIIEVVKLAEGERVPDTVNMISQWQPMETMPLDSKARIVYCPSNKCQFMVSWDRHTDEYRHFGTLDSLDYEASHWQNLQKPPTE
jgi:hypothetical protein